MYLGQKDWIIQITLAQHIPKLSLQSNYLPSLLHGNKSTAFRGEPDDSHLLESLHEVYSRPHRLDTDSQI